MALVFKFTDYFGDDNEFDSLEEALDQHDREDSAIQVYETHLHYIGSVILEEDN